MSDYLIDFHLAIEAMSRISDSICEAEAVDALCEVPTIELIRCKDCKHFSAFKKLPGYVCLNGYGLVNATPEDFCSYAEPKETE
jgi:hypothetical protein